MPMVRIELFSGRSAEQKEACARDVIEAVKRHLGAPAQATQVVFIDIDKSDWLMGAKLLPTASGNEGSTSSKSS